MINGAAVGGMRIVRETKLFRENPSSATFPPQIPHDLTWDWEAGCIHIEGEANVRIYQFFILSIAVSTSPPSNDTAIIIIIIKNAEPNEISIIQLQIMSLLSLNGLMPVNLHYVRFVLFFW
jgi:hypothetical protein